MKCSQTQPDLELLTNLTPFVNNDARFLLKKPPAQKVSPTELQENVMQSTPDVTATHGKVLRRFLEGKAGRLVSQIYGIRILAEIAP